MKKRFCVLAMLVTLMVSTPVFAAGSCYSAAEFEAEQGLRIHSELMVIGLTCLKMPGQQGLYAKYQSFTSKNQNLISMYENDLIGYFRRQGVAKPEKEFHSLRTGLANGISKHAIRMSTSSFCQHFGTRIDQALMMDQQKLRRWAQQVWRDSPTTRPQC